MKFEKLKEAIQDFWVYVLFPILGAISGAPFFEEFIALEQPFDGITNILYVFAMIAGVFTSSLSGIEKYKNKFALPKK